MLRGLQAVARATRAVTRKRREQRLGGIETPGHRRPASTARFPAHRIGEFDQQLFGVAVGEQRRNGAHYPGGLVEGFELEAEFIHVAGVLRQARVVGRGQ